MDQVRCGFSRLSVDQAILKAQTVIGRMENNASFPTPPFPIDELKLLVNHLAQLQGEISASNYMRVASRNECFDKLKHVMATLAAYVNVKAQGNLSMLASSGFDLRKHRAKATIPATINALKCYNMPSAGSIIVNWKGERTRQYYIVETTYNPSDDSSWINAGVATKCKLEIHGLISGQRIYVRIGAVNNAGKSNWSAVSQLMVA